MARMAKKIIQFPTYNLSMGEAYLIVKEMLDDESITMQSKVIALEKVAEMETHNGITKDELVHALRWIFKYYDLLSVL